MESKRNRASPLLTYTRPLIGQHKLIAIMTVPLTIARSLIERFREKSFPDAAGMLSSSCTEITSDSLRDLAHEKHRI